MRIGSSLSGIDLLAQHNLRQAFGSLQRSSLRLSTLQRINSGADDPAGLIAAETLHSEINAIKAASYNTARAQAIVQTADSALGEVGALVGSIRGNVVEAAGSQVLDGRTTLGAFEKYTLESSGRILDQLEQGLSDAYSRIADTDVAEETSHLVRAQLLVQAGISTLIAAGERRGLIGSLLSV